MTALLLLMLGCGGSATQSGTFSEICDNAIDDDGDGNADCEDEDCAQACGLAGGSGTSGSNPTGGGTPLGTVSQTNPSSAISMLLDASYDFEYQEGLSECPVVIGRVIIDNQTAEQAQIIAASTPGELEAFWFELVGTKPDHPWVDWPVQPYSTATLNVKYNCTQTSTFTSSFFVEVTNDLDQNTANVTAVGVFR